jgi:single-stranded-DNA-specific exonuclease
LVALGTVCDVVPLAGLNRALVAQGIKVARRRDNPGLAALAAVAGVAEPIDAYHLGFVLGPRVNAGGRVGAADFGARLLATDDPVIAAELAARLDDYNRERRDIEGRTLEAAIAQVEAAPQSPVLLLAAAENWHPGVIGIVAARLKERYERPACVVAIADGIGRGSGRSVAGLPLGQAIIAARQAGLLINGGGHAMAAGFTVATEKLGALQAFLVERLGDGIGNERLVPELRIDGSFSVAAVQGELIEHVARLAPFGAANPEPRFVFPRVRVAYTEPVGDGHLCCTLLDPLEETRLRGIAFRAMGTPLGQFLCETRGSLIHIAGHVRRDKWRGGDAVQLVIEDAAPTTL